MSFSTSSSSSRSTLKTQDTRQLQIAAKRRMAFPGQRFTVDFDEPTPNLDQDPLPDQGPIIGDILERAPAKATPPKPPSGSGFPQHKKRFPRSFKQQRQQQQQQAEKRTDTQTRQTGQTRQTEQTDEKAAIDQENRHQLASMSDAQIQHEREELLESLDPSLLQRFLQRAQISSPDITQPEPKDQDVPDTDTPAPAKPEQIQTDPPAPAKPKQTQNQTAAKDDLPPSSLPEDLHPAAEVPSFHFPTPSNKPAPTLDPTAPSFLADLQAHYFPNTPHDPSSLDWLAPENPTDASSSEPNPDPNASPYDPTSTAEAIHPAGIRFSLRGTILAPNTALSLPTTLGLHHHGNDPQAAGYTIPELAILGRSSFPAQRCIAWQVLGRILYRLGKGEFGDRGSVLVEGLWEVIEREALVGVMLAEASPESATQAGQANQTSPNKTAAAASAPATGIGRHASATAWAVEGVWLWQQGGSGDRGLLKEGVIRPR